jgi:hypothetical protein
MTKKELTELVALQQYKLAWHRTALHNLREQNLTYRAALEEITSNPDFMAHIIAQVCLSTTIPPLTNT